MWKGWAQSWGRCGTGGPQALSSVCLWTRPQKTTGRGAERRIAVQVRRACCKRSSEAARAQRLAVGRCACVWARACVRASAHACVREWACLCVGVCGTACLCVPLCPNSCAHAYVRARVRCQAVRTEAEPQHQPASDQHPEVLRGGVPSAAPNAVHNPLATLKGTSTRKPGTNPRPLQYGYSSS